MASHKSFGRRSFLKSTAAAAVASQLGATYIPAHAFGKMERPAVAGIGAGGKGTTDIRGAAEAGFDIAALVDVVDGTKLKSVTDKRLKNIVKARESYPDVRFFTDYREMLSDMGDRIDAVLVSTPDHHHYHASSMAMNAGKHVYCQKPLTHSIAEARALNRLAKSTGVKTQMGNQAHANDKLRECVELIRSGVVGKVKAIHSWTNRPIWPQGFNRPPAGMDAATGAINWKQWIGPAPWQDYSPNIAPFNWRGWWDYGTGALGDMACHIMDMGYWAMGLPAPASVKATQNGGTEFSAPINSIIRWKFDANEYSSADGFEYHWYDGYVDAHFDYDKWELVRNSTEYNHPSDEIMEGEDFSKFGSVVIGEAGKLYFRRSGKIHVVSDAGDQPKVPQTLPRAGGNPYTEWRVAIDGKIDQAESHFGQAGPLTETVLLGVLAQRVPDTELVWDAEAMKVKGRPDLQKYIQRDYTEGWAAI